MRAIVVALLFALASPAAAQEQTCYSPEQIVERGKAAELAVKAELKDEELRAFNTQYEQQFHHEAPDVDLVLVFANSDPEGRMVWLAPFKNGCLMAKPVPMSVEVFNQLHGGQPI